MWAEAAMMGISAAGAAGGAAASRRRAQQEARRARNWSEYMASTHYQRTMRDLEAAGLNPMLAGKLSGGSIPGGMPAPVPHDMSGGAAEKAIGAALNVKQTRAQVREREQNALMRTYQMDLLKQQHAESSARTGLLTEQALKTWQERANLTHQAAGLETEAMFHRMIQEVGAAELVKLMQAMGLSAATAATVTNIWKRGRNAPRGAGAKPPAVPWRSGKPGGGSGPPKPVYRSGGSGTVPKPPPVHYPR